MKKVIIIVISIIMVLMLAVGSAYLIDKNRMNNNEPVVFSTWGYDYAPPINHEDITNKIPNISEVSKTTIIPLKENEDLFIDLLTGWEYEISNDEPERYEYAIDFLSPDAKNKMTLYAYKDRFGVCGTELEIKDIVLEDGNIASAGFYDGRDVWTFINFGDDIVMQNGNLTAEESKDALSMIKTIKFVKTHPGHIVSTENLIEDGNNTTIPYIPDGMEIASNDDIGTKLEDITFNRNKENVTIEVLIDTVTPSSAKIVITDKNKDPYGWGISYKIEQKVNEGWKSLKPKTEMIFEEIAYVLDENGQFKQDIDWTILYGELENGTYRIVKDTYDKGYINFYSNEFEI